MRVEVEAVGATHPNRIGEFAVRVLLPVEPPPNYAEMIDRVARSCPAHNTLKHGADVSVRFEIASAAMV